MSDNNKSCVSGRLLCCFAAVLYILAGWLDSSAKGFFPTILEVPGIYWYLARQTIFVADLLGIEEEPVDLL